MLASSKPQFIMGQNDMHKHKIEARVSKYVSISE
jgi:hypothetical protein